MATKKGKRKIKAKFERDESGYWAVTAQPGPNDHAISDGQTLPKARRRIVQAIAELLEVSEDSLEIEEEIVLPDEAARATRELAAATEAAAASGERLDAARRKAAATLSKAGVSRRDVGDILGVSGARVQQILNGTR